MHALPPVTDRDHVRGPAPGEPAAHTLLFYGDFECPSGRQVFLLVRQVQKAYPGAVRYAFRHFPLRRHEHALEAAEATEAAAEQGAFWPMHDRLFQHPSGLSGNDLVMHAGALGLDARAVRDALREGTYRDRILAGKRAAIAAGVRSSLNLVVDGTIFLDEEVEDALLDRVVAPLKAAAG
ncbi:MAG: thioredoxin domain-containing protein [Rubricoccaceae bacterium]|nr:thioredoxin domain-containing protein [Rubricoccaceae bacterium]